MTRERSFERVLATKPTREVSHRSFPLLRSALYVLVAVAPALSACHSKNEGAPSASSSPSASAPGAAAAAPSAPVAFGALERRRDGKAVIVALGQAREPGARRAAARALSRIASPEALTQLAALLADEDPVIVSRAAYALGQACTGKANEYVPALVGRAATLTAELAKLSSEKPASVAPLPSAGAPAPSGTAPSPQQDTPAKAAKSPAPSVAAARTSSARAADVALARRELAVALGRCGSASAEDALRSWLTGPASLAEDAAYGLGHFAAAQGRLNDRSSVALLDTATKLSSEAPLFAFTRLTHLSEAVQTRLLDVAGEMLTQAPGPRRSLAVRALGAAGFAATAPLGRVLSSNEFSAEERAAAAFALGRLGRAGQEELAAAVAALMKNQGAWQQRPALFIPLSAALAALTSSDVAQEELAALARLEIPKDARTWQKRRIVRLRCRAATLAAKATGPLSSELVDCDPEHGTVGALAVLAVLDQGKIIGARLDRQRGFLKSTTPAVHEAALRLLAGHPEVPDATKVLTEALESATPGVVTTAAQVLASYPARAAGSAKDADVDPALAKALAAVFERQDLVSSLETLASATDAVGALGLLNHKGAIQKLCHGPHDELRRHAARALALLGDPKQKCDEAQLLPDQPAGAKSALALELETDLSAQKLRLALDIENAPEAARRLSELARAGYYDGMAVHRFGEGFVVQLGDPTGDSFGDGKHAPLPDEKGPGPLGPLDVGMAVFGKDTAATQFFVALARYPHLDGAFTRVGHAEGPWDELVPGDVVTKVRVIEK